MGLHLNSTLYKEQAKLIDMLEKDKHNLIKMYEEREAKYKADIDGLENRKKYLEDEIKGYQRAEGKYAEELDKQSDIICKLSDENDKLKKKLKISEDKANFNSDYADKLIERIAYLKAELKIKGINEPIDAPVIRKVKKEVTKWIAIDNKNKIKTTCLYETDQMALNVFINSFRHKDCIIKPITITEEVEEVVEPLLIERWMNIYMHNVNIINGQEVYATKDEAVEHRNGYIKDTIKLTGYYYPKGNK